MIGKIRARILWQPIRVSLADREYWKNKIFSFSQNSRYATGPKLIRHERRDRVKKSDSHGISWLLLRPPRSHKSNTTWQYGSGRESQSHVIKGGKVPLNSGIGNLSNTGVNVTGLVTQRGVCIPPPQRNTEKMECIKMFKYVPVRNSRISLGIIKN